MSNPRIRTLTFVSIAALVLASSAAYAGGGNHGVGHMGGYNGGGHNYGNGGGKGYTGQPINLRNTNNNFLQQRQSQSLFNQNSATARANASATGIGYGGQGIGYGGQATANGGIGYGGQGGSSSVTDTFTPSINLGASAAASAAAGIGVPIVDNLFGMARDRQNFEYAKALAEHNTDLEMQNEWYVSQLYRAEHGGYNVHVDHAAKKHKLSCTTICKRRASKGGVIHNASAHFQPVVTVAAPGAPGKPGMATPLPAAKIIPVKVKLTTASMNN